MRKTILILFVFISLCGFSQEQKIGRDLWLFHDGDTMKFLLDEKVDTTVIYSDQKIQIDADKLIVDTLKANIVEGYTPVSFGTDNQIPFVNATNDDFEYSANFTFTGTALGIDNSSITINESGADVDFRAESDGNANMFFIDAGNNRVGIGTNTPTELFSVLAPAASVGVVRIKGGNSTVLATDEICSRVDFVQYDGTLTDGLAGRIQVVSENAVGGRSGMSFQTAYSSVSPNLREGMRLNYLGYLGVGQPSPAVMLHLGMSGGTSGSIRFEQNDGDIWDLGINSSDQATFSNASEYVFDNHVSIPLAKNIYFGDGDSYIFEYTDDGLKIGLGGSDRYIISASYIGTVNNGGAINGGNASLTSPGLYPDRSDLNTGIGQDDDILTLIAGGWEGLRVTESTTDYITVNGNLLTSAATYNIGSSTTRFNRIYADTVHANVFTNSDFVLGESGSDITVNADTLRIENELMIKYDNLWNGRILGKNPITDKVFTIINSNINGGKLQISNESALNNGDIYIGLYSGNATTTGTYNTFVGLNTGSELTEGDYNVLMGSDAGKNITTGSGNTFIGFDAGGGASSTAITGNGNIVIGSDAGQAMEGNVQNNIIIGQNAGVQISDGDGNVIIGANVASASGNIESKLYIDNSNTTTPLIYGDFAADEVTINGELKVTYTTHLFHYFGDSAISKSYTTDWQHLTNSGNEMFIYDENDGFTVSNDTITVIDGGDYDFKAKFAMDADNGETVSIRFYNVTQAAGVPVAGAITGRSANNFMSLPVEGYSGITAGDELVLQYKGDANGTSVFKNGIIKIYKIHE